MNAIQIKNEEDFNKVVGLRKSILHPDGPWGRVRYDSDSRADSFHLAIFAEDHEVLACGSLLMEDESEIESSTIARIRGIAVSEKSQGMGLGKIILKGLLEESERRRVQKIWCNARSAILKFYLQEDFKSVGDEFITAGGIPHYKLIKTISYSENIR